MKPRFTEGRIKTWHSLFCTHPNFQTQTVMKKVGMSSKATTREACRGQGFSRQKRFHPWLQGAVDLWKALGRERNWEIFGLQR